MYDYIEEYNKENCGVLQGVSKIQYPYWYTGC